MSETAVGGKVRMDVERQRYTVMARDDRFVIMAKPFNARRTYIYSIADERRYKVRTFPTLT